MTESGIQGLLGGGIPVTVFPEIDSTNTEAKRRILRGNCPERFLLIAETQTAGRGRLGRSFYSPPGTGIYLSYGFRVMGTPEQVLPVTSAAAVAVADAIREETGIRAGIKWVNDLLLDGKKICGILAESVCADGFYVIVGIGINLRAESFPEALSGTAAALNVPVDRERLVAGIVSRLATYADELPETPFLSAYRQLDVVSGHPVTVLRNSTARDAFAEGIDHRFGLIVRYSDGTRETLRTGEISVRIRA